MRKRLLALLLSFFYALAGGGNEPKNTTPAPEAPTVEIVETTAPTEAPAEELISADKAKSIALDHAGLSASDVTGLRAEYDVDDGVKEFDVEFRAGDYEYDYTINAVTGKIISEDKEYDPEKKPVETNPAETEPPATEPPTTEAPREELISADKAKSIALDHAGLSASDVTGLRAEYDVDDGVKEYDVEFRAGDYEYDYSVNAVSGKIRSHDKEYDPEKKPVETKPAETEPPATEAPAEELISADKAKSIALDHAGLSASDVTGLRAEYDVDDGVKEFDVEFRAGDYEYDYTINAVTGKIISHDKEYDPEKKPVETKPVETESPATEPPATEAPAEELISADKAKSIALDHAGLSASDVTGLRAEYDVDDGVKEYDVEFRAGDYEYDYTINAVTGKIISHDKEYDPEKKPVETKPAETEPPATEAPAEEKISADKAKSIALKHAGVSSKKAKGMECEFDVDDGVKLYEIEFRSGKYEYSYEIDALSGKILSWEKERDD